MNGLFANALFTIHQGKSGGRGLSPRLWARVNGQDMSPDGFSNAYMVGDDFLTFGRSTAVSSTTGRYVGQAGQYITYEENSGAVAQRAGSNFGGIARVTTGAADNDELYLNSGDGSGVLGNIDTASGNARLTIFETRFAVGQIGNTYDAFVGLCEEGLAVSDGLLTDAGAYTSKDLIGFSVNEAAGSTLQFVYRMAGQAVVTPIASLATLAANTFVKAGFVYDPKAPSNKRIKVFVDNVEQSTYVTATQLAAATFPLTEGLSFMAGLKNAEAVAKTLDLDWWNFFQAGQ